MFIDKIKLACIQIITCHAPNHHWYICAMYSRFSLILKHSLQIFVKYLIGTICIVIYNITSITWVLYKAFIAIHLLSFHIISSDSSYITPLFTLTSWWRHHTSRGIHSCVILSIMRHDVREWDTWLVISYFCLRLNKKYIQI